MLSSKLPNKASALTQALINKPPPLNRDDNKDLNVNALKGTGGY